MNDDKFYRLWLRTLSLWEKSVISTKHWLDWSWKIYGFGNVWRSGNNDGNCGFALFTLYTNATDTAQVYFGDIIIDVL